MKYLRLFASILLVTSLNGCVTIDAASDVFNSAAQSVKGAIFGVKPADYKDSDPVAILGSHSNREAQLYKKYRINTVGDYKVVVREMRDSGYIEAADNSKNYTLIFTYLKDREAARQQPGLTAKNILQARQDELSNAAERKRVTVEQAAPKDELGRLSFCTGYLIHAHAVMRDEGPKLRMGAKDRFDMDQVIKQLDTSSNFFMLAGVASSLDLSKDEAEKISSRNVKNTSEGVEFARARIENDPTRIFMPGQVKEDILSCGNQAPIAKNMLKKWGYDFVTTCICKNRFVA